MPLLAVHMSIVQQVVERLDDPGLNDNIGAVLLGATAPDRRVMTRQPREETHFFRLMEDGMGDGLRGLRAAHPEMTERLDALDWSTRAFLIGYLCHLTADEAWICGVYRPFFANSAYLGDEPARNILDRALQYDLERGVLEDRDRLVRWHKDVESDALTSVPESFILASVLAEWRQFVMDVVLTRDGGWHEFPRFIARFKDDPGLDEAEVDEFLADPDVMFRRVYAKVPRDIIASHRENAIEASVEIAREFLP